MTRSGPAVVLLGLFSLLVVGCDQSAESVRGLVLPAGDAQRGQLAFVDLGCTRCHTVAGVALEPYVGEMPLTIELGGEIYRVKTYGELVTSIINPDHVLSPKYVALLPPEQRRGAPSAMPSFNDTMTVAQLLDLVSFLHGQYVALEPEYVGPMAY